MNKIVIPRDYNYIGVFLTFACNLKCSYCINKYNTSLPKYKQMGGYEWIQALNRIETRADLPITLGGGEPTLHPDFYTIINGIRPETNIDLLTNIQFDIEKFVSNIDPNRLMRHAKYASIRVSYHLETMWLTQTIDKVKRLQDLGYSVGVWMVDHPKDKKMLELCKAAFEKEGIDCRMKEFLGEYKGKLYGSYKYPKAMNRHAKTCNCKPSELLIAPDGSIHKCHYSLYSGNKGYASMLDTNVDVIDIHTMCNKYGMCNPCDIKTKFDRYQVPGHCSVGIKEV